MTIFILSFLLFLSVVLNIAIIYFLYKFSKIILTFEDDITEVVTSLTNVEDSMKSIDSIKMFYEDNTIQNVVNEILDDVRLSRFYINLMIKRFTDRSKQRYETVEPSQEDIERFLEAQRAQPEQEGTIAHVGRPG